MKTLSVVIGALILVFGAVVSYGANVDRISAETGVPVGTLQTERASTGLGWGGLEKAHLLANESGQSFDTIVGKFQGGEGWGRIAHDYGLNLGHVVSSAHRSSQATTHAQNLNMVHGKSASAHGKKATTAHGRSAAAVRGRSTTNIGRGHSARMATTRGAGRSSSFRSSVNGFHGMHSMGHMSGFHSMHSMGGMGHGMGGMSHGGHGR